jgi:hypothetical protein
VVIVFSVLQFSDSDYPLNNIKYKVQDYDFYVTITDGHVTFFSNQIIDADEASRSSEIFVNLIIIPVEGRTKI